MVDAQVVLPGVGMDVKNHCGGETTHTVSGQAITGDLKGTTALGSPPIPSNQTQPVNHQAPVAADQHKHAAVDITLLRTGSADNPISKANELCRRANKYLNGDGVPMDPTRAFKLYMKAAEAGLAEAQNIIGYLFSSGTGVQQNDTKAVEYYRKAAAQDHLVAQYNLATMFCGGWGVRQDYAEAVKLYLGLAEHGDADAEYNLAMFSIIGQGMPEDRAEALKWFGLAASHGHQDALSAIYDCAHGIDLDLTDIQEAELCRIATEILKKLDV